MSRAAEMSEQQCCGEVRNPTGSMMHRWKRCNKRGKIEREGKFYCGIHDPESIQERRNKNSARFEEKWQADQKAWRFRNNSQLAIKRIAAGHNDPVELAKSVIEDRYEP